VDRYRFEAGKGQKLVISAAARDLMPYLADAVPGWFQASLSVYDWQGKEVAFADHYRFHPDPVLFFEVLRDGEYILQIRDSIYRGREDFVYRLTAGEVPFVTGIFPLGGPAGAPTIVQVTGWNLPAATVTQDDTSLAPGTYPTTSPSPWTLCRKLLPAKQTIRSPPPSPSPFPSSSMAALKSRASGTCSVFKAAPGMKSLPKPSRAGSIPRSIPS
jgi:hypothetical protein